RSSLGPYRMTCTRPWRPAAGGGGRGRRTSAAAGYEAPRRLAEASKTMSETGGSFQLRLLQTVAEVAAEKNSTLVMPFPVELLRFFDQPGRGGSAMLTPASGDGRAPKAATAGRPAGRDGHRPSDQ